MKCTKQILRCMLMLFVGISACEPDDKIGPTSDCDGMSNDSSALHPKAVLYQSVLDDYVARGLPGITAAIRDQNGLWLGSAGMADIKKALPYQYCHVSKAASITKMFVATLTFLLIEEGVLSLDDPLSKWLSEKQLKDIKNARQATIRSCLGHTTGIADLIKDQAFYLAVLNDPDKFWEEEELLDFVRGDDAVFPHGDSVKYSNTNTLLVALAIESATGRSHEALVREYLIEPLQLHHTYYYWHDIPPANVVAQGYFDLYNNGTLVNLTNYNTGSGNGYGGLYSTVTDLMHFVDQLFRHKTLLRPESLNHMLSFGRPEKDKNRQLGLGAMKSFTERVPDQFAYGHSGRDLGYTADAFYFPNQDMTLSFMVNYGTDAESRLQSTFFDFRTAIVDAMMIR